MVRQDLKAAPSPAGGGAAPAPGGSGPSRRALVLGGLTGLAGLGAIGGCAALWPGAGEPPALPREWRAAWVATVAQIDWPSRNDLGTEAQRAEMVAMLDQAAAVGLNALILQVRPAADALYASALEPWSEVLTGVQGRAPGPLWDPLAEWVDGAHRRGLELHAWFNPYRARHPSARSEPAPGHVMRSDPAIVRRYGDLAWMDPAEPRAARRMLDVVLDVVRRYDIDGVHIDDYFYPYPQPDGQGGERPFPDDEPWARYQAGGGSLSRADWRRGHVDALIATLHREIHAAKPWVRFGISPFGLPRPDRRPAGIEGFSPFDKLYADVERWADEGWLDILVPQLYWPRAQAAQAFEPLLDTWLRGNPHGRHVWPGLFTSRIGAARNAYTPDEVLGQIDLVRSRPAAGGHAHFSMVALLHDREGIAARLQRGPYARPALPPATPWLPEPAPPPPAWHWQPLGEGLGRLTLQAAPGSVLRQVAWWALGDEGWSLQLLPVLPGQAVQAWVEPRMRRVQVLGLGRTGLASAPLSGWQRLGGWRFDG